MAETPDPVGERIEHLLGTSRFHILTHALEVAAERFDADAKVFAGRHGDVVPAHIKPDGAVAIVSPLGASMLVDQFRRQAEDTRQVLQALTGGDVA